MSAHPSGPLQARLALAELYASQARWAELDEMLKSLAGDSSAAAPCAVLRARTHLAHGEFAAARKLLQQAIACEPRQVQPRLLLAQTYLQEGIDPAAAEAALLEALALDPTNDEAIGLLVWLHRRIGLQWG
jgi:Tfp pilus assembly protein PilF